MRTCCVCLIMLTFSLSGVLGAEDSIEFKEFVSKEGRFSILIPGIPTEAEEVIRIPAYSVKAKVLMVLLDQGRVAYGISYADFPTKPETLQKDGFLDSIREGGIERVKGKLISEKKTTIENLPAKEWLVEAASGNHFRTRGFVNENRLYQVIVGGTKDFVQSKDADNFFDSFKLYDPSDWQEYDLKEGRFKVLLPDKPTKRERQIGSPVGKIVHTTFGINSDDGKSFYGVLFWDYPTNLEKSPDEAFLDDLRDRSLTGFKGKLLSEQKIKLDKRPGREMFVDSQVAGILRCRTYLDNRRIYQVMVGGSDSFVKSKNAEKFLDSFKLIE